MQTQIIQPSAPRRRNKPETLECAYRQQGRTSYGSQAADPIAAFSGTPSNVMTTVGGDPMTTVGADFMVTV